VYAWQPFAISLGWNQSMDEIDLAKTSASGIDVVRRPTGGRAILHSEELTYSVVMRVKEKNVLSVYDDISRALVTGLLALGAPVAIEKSQPHFPSLYRTTSAVACFSSTGRYEIKYQKKNSSAVPNGVMPQMTVKKLFCSTVLFCLAQTINEWWNF
jgi:lipoate-protein ligase A